MCVSACARACVCGLFCVRFGGGILFVCFCLGCVFINAQRYNTSPQGHQK